MAMNRFRRNAGISLIEVMVAMVAGLVVIGAVLSFTVATIRTNGEAVAVTRVNQELRSLMDVMAREIRRAGFNASATAAIGTGATSTNHSTIESDTSVAGSHCILFGYDTPDAGGADSDPGTVGDSEWKGFRRTTVSGVGVLQMRTGGAAMTDCSGANTWSTISSPRSVDITGLTYSFDGPAVDCGVATDTGTGNQVNVSVRTLTITINGRLVNDPTVTRSLRERVRIRADRIFQTASCS